MKNVKKYYTKFGIEEWDRLEKTPLNRLEFITTMAYLKRYLPKKGRILDAGGGPGRYTIEMAKKGYKVTLLDYTPKLLEIAAGKIKKAGIEKNVEGIIEGDIRDLSMFKESSFDAVLCLGAPVSHLVKRKDRVKAVKELRRVAKKGAPVFISVIGKLGIISKAIWAFPRETTMRYFRIYRDTGNYFGGHGFTATHMFLLDDLKSLVKFAGLNIIKTIGLEGLASPNDDIFNKFARNKKQLGCWLETHFKTCEIPSVADTSQHILIIARR